MDIISLAKAAAAEKLAKKVEVDLDTLNATTTSIAAEVGGLTGLNTVAPATEATILASTQPAGSLVVSTDTGHVLVSDGIGWSDLGPVAIEAYTAAVSGGYLGTKEEFETEMASIQTVVADAEAQVSLAADQVALAESQVTLATEQVGLAEDQVALASTRAAEAQTSATSAISSANNKGLWSNLTGALNIPASVNHNGIVWVLNSNLTDITLSEPTDENTEWTKAGAAQEDLDSVLIEANSKAVAMAIALS